MTDEYDGSDAAFAGFVSGNLFAGAGSAITDQMGLGAKPIITYKVVESGPMPIRIHGNAEQIRYCARHIHVARVLMSQMQAASGPVVFQKMQRRMYDGALIVTYRNQTSEGAEPLLSADIYPPTWGGGQSEQDQKHRAPFIWVGMKHDFAPGETSVNLASMAVWEPGSQTERWESDSRGLIGGQVLIPVPGRGEVGNGVFAYEYGSELDEAPNTPYIAGLCETAGLDHPPSAVSFEPWHDIEIEYNGSTKRLVATNAGLVGGIFSTPDILNPDVDGPWEQFFLLEPHPGGIAINETTPPNAEIENKQRNDFLYPRMEMPWWDDLSEEDRRKLVGHVLPGKYLLRFGVSGGNFKPGEMPDVQQAVPNLDAGGWYPPEVNPEYPPGAVPIIVKVVTAKFPYHTVTMFRLTVQAQRPSYARFQFYPKRYASGYADSALGSISWIPNRELGPGEELEDLIFPDDFTPVLVHYYIGGGGPVPLGDGVCINNLSARDEGKADGTSYDPRIIEIDPWGGARIAGDKTTWGMP